MKERSAISDDYPQLLLERQLCFPLYAAARKIVTKYTPVLKPLGITYTQYIVFLYLWEYGDSTVGELCRSLYLDTGTITPLLKKLEESDLIVRRRSSRDERVVTVSLTENGKDLKAKAADVPYKIGGCVALSEKDAASLYSILYKLLDEPGQNE